MNKITHLWAVIETFPEGEGIASTVLGDRAFPLVMTNMGKFSMIANIAMKMKEQGKTVTMKRFVLEDHSKEGDDDGPAAA